MRTPYSGGPRDSPHSPEGQQAWIAVGLADGYWGPFPTQRAARDWGRSVGMTVITIELKPPHQLPWMRPLWSKNGFGEG